MVRLKTSAMDCEFACPNCHHNLLTTHVKDQFIDGVHNDFLKMNILIKAHLLKLLENIAKHVVAFEIAIHDQQSLQNTNSNHASAA